MPKKTIIHVGLHKTASTFLQTGIFPGLKNHLLITRPYTQHNHSWNALQYADDTFFDENDFLNEIARYKSQPLVISDESLSGKPVNFGYINRTTIARRLARFFPEAEVIICLRGQKELIKSHFNQWVKESPLATRKFSEFIWFSSKNHLEIPDNGFHPPLSTLKFNTNNIYLHLESLRFFELIKLYKSLFSQVHIILYEDIKDNPNNVRLHLSEIFEAHLPDFSANQAGNQNKSVPLTQLESYIIKNRAKYLKENILLKKFVRFLIKPEGTPFDMFESDLTKLCTALYAEDNQKLQKEYPEINLSSHSQRYFLAKCKSV